MDTCHEVVDAVTDGEATQDELAHWISQMVQFSQDLDQTLAETVESHLAMGPTPFPVVNLVNAAMDRYLGQVIPSEELADTMDQCEDWLRGQLPTDTDPAMHQAADELFKVLQEMRQTTLANDVDLLISQRESLFAAAENLAMFAAVLSPDEGVVNVVSVEGLSGGSAAGDERPMPALLATIIQQAESYLSGSQNSDKLEESLQALEKLVTSTEGKSPVPATVPKSSSARSKRWSCLAKPATSSGTLSRAPAKSGSTRSRTCSAKPATWSIPWPPADAKFVSLVDVGTPHDLDSLDLKIQALHASRSVRSLLLETIPTRYFRPRARARAEAFLIRRWVAKCPRLLGCTARSTMKHCFSPVEGSTWAKSSIK
jgi:hypothetical protein